VWEVATGKELLTFEGTPRWVGRVAFSPDGKKLVAVGAVSLTASQFVIWNLTDGPKPRVKKLIPEQQPTYSVAFSRDGQRLFTGGYDNTVMAWDAVTADHLFTLKGHSAGVLNLVVSPDGKRLISSSGDINNNGVFNETIVWNLATRQQVLMLKGHKD